MTEILPLFQGGGPKVGAAMSEPFLRRDDFIAVKSESTPEVRDSDLLGMATAYIDGVHDGEGRVDYVLLLDPNKKFGREAAARAFNGGYDASAGAALQMAEELRREGNLDPGIERYVEGKALAIPYEAGLLTVASVAVFGTPEDYSGELIVPRKTVEQIALEMRETMLEAILSGDGRPEVDGVDSDMADEAMRAVTSQHSVMQNFGIIGAVNHLAKVDLKPAAAEA